MLPSYYSPLSPPKPPSACPASLQFKAIYVVDLCKSLCDQARKKVAEKGWRNVHVVEADACHFAPPEGIASLATFSYSLSSE